MHFRDARRQDVPALLAIYRPYIEDNAVSFETEVPSEENFAARVDALTPRFPWLVAENDAGEVMGYAYASAHRDRAAYRFSAEVSAYVGANHQRKGVAAALYRRVLAILDESGMFNVYAGIALPNDASVGFHESFGFTLIGVYQHVGYKFGAWHDVGWWGLDLRQTTHERAPKEPIPAHVLRDSAVWKQILDDGLRHDQR